MQKKKIRQSTTVSQPIGKCDKWRGKQLLRDRKQKSTKGSSSFAGNSFYTLKLRGSIKSKSIVQILACRNSEHFYGSIESQNNVIKALYNIIIKHPDFVDREDWSINTPSWEVLEWILEIFENYLNGLSWEIDEDSNVHIFKPYEISDDMQAVPMDFLPLIQTSFPELFEIMIPLISLLYRKSGIQLWNHEDDDYVLNFIEDQLQQAKEEEGYIDEDSMREMEEIINNYYNGDAYQFLQLIIRNKITIEELNQLVNNFKTKSELENNFLEWIQEGISLIKEPFQLNDFVFHKNKEVDNPLLPCQYLRFIWSDNDLFFQQLMENLDHVYQNYGTEPPYFDVRCDDTFNWQYSVPDFPVKVSQFLINGINLIQSSIFTKS